MTVGSSIGSAISDPSAPEALPKGFDGMEAIMALLRERTKFDALVQRLGKAKREADAAHRAAGQRLAEVREAEAALQRSAEAQEKAAKRRAGELDAREVALDGRAEAMSRQAASLKDREAKLRQARADFRAERERQAGLARALAEELSGG